VTLDDEELEQETAQAEELLEEESSRARQGVHLDPSKKKGLMSDEDIASLRRRHTFLQDFSDSFIRGTPVGDLMKIETTALKMKEMEKAKDALDRLAANKTALSSTFTVVTEGRDNRWNVLHPARFLGGAGCSATKLWLAAREVLGLQSLAPLGNYDLEAVGLAGHVSAKGWVELANVAGSKLSIKMFNIDGGGGARGGPKKKDGEEEFGEFVEVEEFKLALRTMRTAVMFAMPWNMSVLALEGFFFQHNFCMEDLSNMEKKVWYLSRFTDYVLEQNSDRWRDAEPFLTAGELKATWAAFFGAKPKAQHAKKREDKPKQAQSKVDPKVTLGICFAWNQGLCVKAPGACKTAKGRELKHICDHNPDPSKPLVVCGKDHIRKNFH